MMTNAEIDALPLSTRAKGFLRMARDDGADWLTMTEWQMDRYPNVGRRTVREISDYRASLLPHREPLPQPPLVAQIRDAIIVLERVARALEQNKTET